MGPPRMLQRKAGFSCFALGLPPPPEVEFVFILVMCSGGQLSAADEYLKLKSSLIPYGDILFAILKD